MKSLVLSDSDSKILASVLKQHLHNIEACLLANTNSSVIDNLENYQQFLKNLLKQLDSKEEYIVLEHKK